VTGATLVRRRPQVSLLEHVASTDHKRLGLATVVTALGFFFAAGLLALLMRSELAVSGLQIVSEETYNQLFTIHGSTMFFLFASPMALGVGLYFVPLQIGASDLMWPRAALLGYWLFLGGGITLWSGFLTESGAADFAWFAFYPLSDSVHAPGTGADFWVLGVALSQAGVFLMGACLLATIIRRRAPGMTLLRMPVFTWSQVATVLMVVPAFPVVVAAMLLLYVDRNWTDVFSVPGGTVTWQHLFWFYAHPLVYVVFFPLVGAVGEVIATFSRRRFFGYSVTILSLLVFAALSTSVWGHHMMTQETVDNRFFSLTSTAIAVPAGIEYFAFIGTMWGGRIRLRAPMLFALGFMLLFLIGGLSGIFVASPPLDYHVHDSYAVVAHFHYTLFGGTVFGLFAAIYYWFPKVTGRLLGESLGRWHALLMFVGALLTFIPMFFLGYEGMPRQVADYAGFRGWDALNVVATVGAWTIFASLVLFLVNLFRSLRLGERAGPDPWEGQTLEWLTSSPPPRHNFSGLVPVRSYSPLLDLRHAGEDPHAVAAGRGLLATEAAPTAEEADPDEHGKAPS
jgi:cytochrome c oxidase subunit 1